MGEQVPGPALLQFSKALRSPLDLTPLWLTPNRDDLTFYNLSTHNSAAGSTRNFQVCRAVDIVLT